MPTSAGAPAGTPAWAAPWPAAVAAGSAAVAAGIAPADFSPLNVRSLFLGDINIEIM